MSSNFLRNTALTLSTLLLASVIAAPRPHFASSTAALSQPANDGNGPGGGDPNPDCPGGSDCVVHAL